MKRLFARFLAALLAATLLLTPAAMMEESADVTLAVEAIEESATAADAGEADGATVEAEEIADSPIAAEDVDLIEDEVSADFAGEDFEAELPVETVFSPAMDYSGASTTTAPLPTSARSPSTTIPFPTPFSGSMCRKSMILSTKRGTKTLTACCRSMRSCMPMTSHCMTILTMTPATNRAWASRR